MRKRDESVADLIGGRWDATRARRALAAARRSGMSLSEFARRHGVNAQRLSWWRWRLKGGAKQRTAEPTSAVAFIPAEVRGSAAVIVQLAGGVVLEVGETAAVAPRWIAELARELSRAS